MRERGGVWALCVLGGLAIAMSALAPRAAAQQVQPFEYARPGQPTMTLYIWGAVSRPGIWHVEREATLVEILSLANVQAGGSEGEGVRVERFLRVYRGSGAPPTAGAFPSRDLVYEVPLEDLMSAQSALELRDGDVLAVEVETHRTWFTLRNISSVIGTAASLTLLIIRLSDL